MENLYICTCYILAYIGTSTCMYVDIVCLLNSIYLLTNIPVVSLLNSSYEDCTTDIKDLLVSQ